jgi:hypothetical protein
MWANGGFNLPSVTLHDALKSLACGTERRVEKDVLA